MFGKAMENLRLRRQIDLVTTLAQLKKLTKQPSFCKIVIFHENLAAVERVKVELFLNRPIYTGFCVLDLSKELMYKFHYEYIKTKYPGIKSNLLFTDTDSLLYEIKTEDIYADMNTNSDLFDFSEYAVYHKCFSNKNKKVYGKMKDELNGLPMLEFVALKAKMYSFKTENEEKKRAKGIQRAVIKKKIKHDDFKKVVFDNTTKTVTTFSIQSNNHILHTVKQRKKALCAFDDKRYILEDGIKTLPYGHFSLRK